MTAANDEASQPAADESVASDLGSPEIESASIYLLKKAASGIPVVTAAVWETMKDFAQTENNPRAVVAANTQAFVENYLLSSALSPYHLAMRILSEDENSSDCPDATPCDPSEEEGNAGLMFLRDDTGKVDCDDRLDHEITQVDVSRMERNASMYSDAQARESPLTVLHGTKESSKSPRRAKDDSVLLQDGQVIEQYFESERENRYPGEGPPQFSWMVVPVNQDDGLTRMSSSMQASNVPHSIVCHSDDESVRSYPSKEEDSASHKGTLISSPTEDASEHNEDPQAQSCHSNGSVPSWAFVRIGSLLSAKNEPNC